MSSPQHCLAMAEEADRLAGIVSYERDRERLRDQAEAWRKMAAAMTAPAALTAIAPVSIAPAAMVAASVPSRPRGMAGVAGWLKRRSA